MSLRNPFTINPAFVIVSPSNSFPIFLLVFQEYVLKIEIFSHLYFDIFCLIELASHRKCLNRIRYVSDCVLLRLSIFSFYPSVLVVLVTG